MMHSATFVKIIVVYGHIDENGHFVRKWSSRKMAITDKCSKNSVDSDYGHISEITVLPVTEVKCSD